MLYYSRSLMFDADSAVVLSNRAQAYLALKEWAKAEADGDTAVRKDPTYVKAWVRRAAARRKRGKYLEAIRDLQQALKLDPGNKAVGVVVAFPPICFCPPPPPHCCAVCLFVCLFVCLLLLLSCTGRAWCVWPASVLPHGR